MENQVQYLIDTLYNMIYEAPSQLVARDKCVIVREEALDLLDDLRGQLPVELKKAQDLIRARDEYVENAKKEAERIRRQADMDDDALRRTEEAIQMALEEIRESRARFRAVSTEVLQAQRAKLEEQGGGDNRR